jgi:hypothetical protein
VLTHVDYLHIAVVVGTRPEIVKLAPIVRMLGNSARFLHTEPFSSCDFPGLKDVDGFGQLPGFPGAAAEFAQDAPGLELRVGAFTRAA